jgi:hypothetical protein
MVLAFCATPRALALCLATLPPAVLPVTLPCAAPDAVEAGIAQLPAGAAVLLEREAPDSLSYQAAAAYAVSMLSKQTEFVILAPSLLAPGLLALDAAGPCHAGCLHTAAAVTPLLASPAVRLLLLDGDAFAWYEQTVGVLRVGGQGCAVLVRGPVQAEGLAGRLAPSLAAGVTLDVLGPGAATSW